MTMSILELLQHIVNEDAPRLTPEEKFPPDSTSFVNSCLFKDPDARPAPKDLLVSVCVCAKGMMMLIYCVRNTNG